MVEIQPNTTVRHNRRGLLDKDHQHNEEEQSGVRQQNNIIQNSVWPSSVFGASRIGIGERREDKELDTSTLAGRWRWRESRDG